MMKLYNTLTKKLETFKPDDAKEVKMYVCGITPYDTTHLGHAFTYMAFDVLFRYLSFKGYKVTYVQNVTDIDDDILKRAKSTNKNWKSLGDFWTDKFLKDLKVLTIEMPTHYVKATETIPTIIELVKKLEKQGYAYVKGDNVYFDVKKVPDYGKLSKYDRETMIKLSKERGANPDDPNKKDPLDFILWQKSLPDEPFWESPWNKGRPGWHIECSAMIYKYLYNYIDIHGGGTDLIYPHHESEIAQSEQFTGHKPFSKYWLHTGAVGYKGEKMSKSLGNLIMISDLLKVYSPNSIRYLLLSHHYRNSWEFKETQFKEIKSNVALIEELPKYIISTKEGNHDFSRNDGFKSFKFALDNDLNTPQALQIMEKSIIQKDYKTARKMSEILGFSF